MLGSSPNFNTQWLEHFAARVALGEAHNGPVQASKPKKDAGEQHRIKMFPKWLQTSRLDSELDKFTTCAHVEAAAAVNAADPPPTFPSEDRPLPATYELDNQMDTTEDLVTQDPEAGSCSLMSNWPKSFMALKKSRNLLLEGEDVSALCTYFHTMLPLEHGILYTLIVVV